MMFDSGTTAFMIVATSLVMLMTPGLAFFYGGLANKKNIVGIMMQTFVSLGITSILWLCVGYSLCFSGDGAILGNLDKAFLQGVAADSVFSGNAKIPELVFISYQMMFAIITPVLITGAFVNRVTFKAFLIFLVLWQFLVYYPFVHMVWGGGFLASMGVLDFAGGIPVHAIAGFGALGAVFYVGGRREKDEKPHSIPLIAIGAGILWFGWYGFNAGSELNLDQFTALALINTDISASFAAISWLMIEWAREGKPKFVGLLTGALAGLVIITPAAAYVSMPTAALYGIVGGTACYFAIQFKNKMEWDDALDVWGLHGVGGVLGMIMLGIFSSSAVNPAATDGLFFGGELMFFITEVGAVVGASVYAFIFTYGMLRIIEFVTPVKVSEEFELKGLDEMIHGELAYDYDLSID
ncbi:ammonium transporter [Methanococcoides methylutens]|uniref:Ammonium transporter n=2 Tax=Methanococcoides methylutens TaxID=2226 RepID=A0A099T0K1_METMT|nr:ammonium transporter [Methanococcoides methylutens]